MEHLAAGALVAASKGPWSRFWRGKESEQRSAAAVVVVEEVIVAESTVGTKGHAKSMDPY